MLLRATVRDAGEQAVERLDGLLRQRHASARNAVELLELVLQIRVLDGASRQPRLERRLRGPHVLEHAVEQATQACRVLVPLRAERGRRTVKEVDGQGVTEIRADFREELLLGNPLEQRDSPAHARRSTLDRYGTEGHPGNSL
jgi:hypothetical protein